MASMTSLTQQGAMITMLRRYDLAYSRGAPLVTDEQYDAARAKARATDVVSCAKKERWMTVWD